ncbi:MAG TPA: sensor histidine kinase [Nocardioides sp.]|nr:sensor histidine kinase [Nocardioides sp.]
MSSATAAPTDTLDDLPSPAREAAVVGIGVLVLAAVGYGAYLGFQVSNLHNGLLALTFTAVGLYVLRMRPGHRVGVLFVASGLLSAAMYFGRQYGLDEHGLPGAAWAAWVSIWLVPLSMALSGLAIMAFPTGRLVSPRWRAPAVAMVAACLAVSVASALWPIEDDWRSSDVDFPFHVGGSATAADVGYPVMVGVYQAVLVLWVAAVLVRVRRATGDETRQLRWFVSAVAVMAVVLAGGLFLTGSAVPGLITTCLVPVAAGVAIVKHRLYDIDPVINKAFVVGAMVLVVTAGYVGVVVVLGSLVPAPDGVLSLVATALVAVAFEPVRRRAQQLADRMVYGHRATPYEALAQLSARLQDAPEALLEGIAATVAGAVGATSVTVWVGAEDALLPAAAWPDPPQPSAPVALPELDEPRLHVRPVVHHGEVRGAIALRKAVGDALTAPERQLLADLVAQTGLVIDHRGKEQELRAAARRIVTAADAARGRIERDLHDGAQQRLVALSIELVMIAEAASAAGSDALAGQAREARDHLLEATTELRELARGLHPALLTRAGLEAAVTALADRAPVPVKVCVDLPYRPPAEVEATAYFLVAEALTNVARYAGATTADVTVAPMDEGLRVAVRDDGRGGADEGRGSGLRGLADRLAALGASLEVDSPAGGGTTVAAVIPFDTPRPSAAQDEPCA